ncbi:hypothetical protein F2P81_006265 [Scophthalmus maximus]|uniref:Uncharacterized protein n=1 Tax=Scophthalmus maximus TaxID=52904 RepID=A0A6A4T2Q4_SCOMX|nr:hypothetical protein F2P81_006265 [Scophthalmus maximus]
MVTTPLRKARSGDSSAVCSLGSGLTLERFDRAPAGRRSSAECPERHLRRTFEFPGMQPPPEKFGKQMSGAQCVSESSFREELHPCQLGGGGALTYSAS